MLLLALSINGGLKTLGSYAGLAAIVALALLALLYFAQARELKRLSEWAEREAARRQVTPPPVVRAVAEQPAAVRPPMPGVPAPIVAPGAAGAPVVTSVEGVRRVPIPAALAAAPTGVVPAVPAAPDSTTVGGDMAPPTATTEAPAATEAESAAQPTAAEAPAVTPSGEPTAQPPLPPAPEPVEPALSQPPLPPAPESAGEPAATQPRLIADAVPGQPPGTVHEIAGGVVIGRGKVATIRLKDPLASARHARIARQGEQFMLEDLGSTNGTFLNGVLMSAPTALTEGDRIRLGESEFVYASAPPTAGNGSGQPSPAAVPLLAAPAPERALELDHESLREEPAAAPPPHEPLRPLRRLRRPFVHEPPESDPATRLPPAPELERSARGPARLLLVGLVVVAIAAVAIAVVELGPGSGGGKSAQGRTGTSTPPASSSTSTSTSKSTGGAAPPAPASVTVAVLNATGRPGLAGGVSAQLGQDGYVKGAIANAPSPAATTTVGYATGERPAALEVARSLHLAASDVVPVSSAAAAAAGAAKVVVTLGSDYHG